MVEAMYLLFTVKNFLLVCRIDNDFNSLSVGYKHCKILLHFLGDKPDC